MINKNDLLQRIEYSDKWNNAKCPKWVLELIRNFPEDEATVDCIFEWLGDVFEQPCKYTINEEDISKFMIEHAKDYCSNVCNYVKPKDCWKVYFEEKIKCGK